MSRGYLSSVVLILIFSNARRLVVLCCTIAALVRPGATRPASKLEAVGVRVIVFVSGTYLTAAVHALVYVLEAVPDAFRPTNFEVLHLFLRVHLSPVADVDVFGEGVHGELLHLPIVVDAFIVALLLLLAQVFPAVGFFG